MTEQPFPTVTITREAWQKAKQHGYASGSPAKGTAKVLQWVEGVGTCLVLVNVEGEPMR